MHLLTSTTSQVIATLKFPQSGVTVPAEKPTLISLTWIWLSLCRGGRGGWQHYRHSPPHQSPCSKGKPHTIWEVEIFNHSLTEQSTRFTSPLLCTEAFQAVLSVKHQLLPGTTSRQRPLMHIRRIQAQKGQWRWRWGGEDSSGIFRNSSMVKRHLPTCYTLSVYVPQRLLDHSHLNSGQSTAMNPYVRSRFYRSAEAEQKEKVQVSFYLV